ncbi:MAG: DUF6600 domain-containing protein [Acidobacteriaceae bacterium]
MKWILALVVCLTTAGFAAAQDQAMPPAPPPDQSQVLQQSSPTLQQAAPESQVRAVRLSAVEGSVKVLEGGNVSFQQAELNMPLVQGMKLVTAQDGRAEVQFEDGSVARVTPNSSITLTQLSRDDSGVTVTGIEADSGLTYYELDGHAGQYTVQFGRDKVVPLDGSIFRLDLDHPQVELAVMHGSVHVSDDENLAMDVNTDQSVQFDPQNADEYQLAQSVTANSWDQWNSDRDEALAELDTSETDARSSTAEPDNPAWSDLDANGDWYNVPGYGMGWSPSGVGQDWDPYGLGAWGYYSGIGYTWISGYSWGWWPYHCGAWSWFDGFGWMWFPGNCGWGGTGVGMGWYPYGTIWNVPAGYRCPRRPAHIHLPGRNPVDHPHHGPVQHPGLIAVNRGGSFTQQIRPTGVSKVKPHMLFYDGQNIRPVEAKIHPPERGPLGDGFSTARQIDNGEGLQGVYNGSVSMGPVYRSSPDAERPVVRPGYQARRGFGEQGHPAPASGVRIPAFRPPPTRAPVFRPAPQPVRIPAFHPAPSPAFHSTPAPAFHPAPAPAPAPAGRGRH